MLALIADRELSPLLPAEPGQEISGAIFRLDPQRIAERIFALDGTALSTLVERFSRAWCRVARPGMPEGDALETFRRAKADEGQADTERFLRNWAELRTLLAVARSNDLEVALLFYEGA